MLIRKAPAIRYSEVTPRAEYMSRRSLLASTAAGLLLTGGSASAAKLAPSQARVHLAPPSLPRRLRP